LRLVGEVAAAAELGPVLLWYFAALAVMVAVAFLLVEIQRWFIDR
jgi:hypothetical protein